MQSREKEARGGEGGEGNQRWQEQFCHIPPREVKSGEFVNICKIDDRLYGWGGDSSLYLRCPETQTWPVNCVV